jgi:hypothetical protein
MSIYKEKIIDAITGEESWRDYTAEEIAQVEAFEADLQKERLKVEAAEAAKATAQAKLSALGLTTDDLKALGL